MNIHELQTDIQDHKKRFGELYDEVSEITLPFFMLHQKIFNGICQIEEQKYKLSNSESDVLITTFVSGDEEFVITPTKLHQKLLFTTGAITKVLKKLEEKNYIQRIANESDKRNKLVQLTPLGIETAKNIFQEIMSFQTNNFGALSQKEQESFKKTLLKILKEL